MTGQIIKRDNVKSEGNQRVEEKPREKLGIMKGPNRKGEREGS